MFNVKDNFRSGMPVAAVPAAWFNKVAAALNYLTVGMFLRFTRPDMPSAERPFLLELDVEALRQELGPGEIKSITTSQITDWAAATANFLIVDDIGSSVAAQSHTHTASQITGLGDAATKNVGTTAGTVAAGNHTHSNYATLVPASGTAPATPRIYKDANGTVQSSAVGGATTAARADHIHLLPEDLLDTYTADQYITGAKHFRADKLVVNAAASGTTAIMLFKSGNNSTLFGRISSTASTLVLHRGNNSGADSTLTVRDGAVDFAKQGQTGQITFYYSGNILCRGMANNGGGIRFQFGNATTDTASIKETASGVVTITAQNHARLSHQPITDTTATGYNALQIATVKTVADASVAKTDQTGIVRNAAGTISYINNPNQTQTIDVITDVVWTGTKLQKKKKTLTFTYGVLTAVSDETTVDIDTAVTYNP